MKSDLSTDVKKVLDLLEEMTDDLKSDCEEAMRNMIEAMGRVTNSDPKVRFNDATQTMQITIDIDARHQLQTEMIRVIKDLTETYHVE